jgi:hypothetical protein
MAKHQTMCSDYRRIAGMTDTLPSIGEAHFTSGYTSLQHFTNLGGDYVWMTRGSIVHLYQLRRDKSDYQ